jgi:endonuclease YncB( thermonuclease family)
MKRFICKRGIFKFTRKNLNEKEDLFNKLETPIQYEDTIKFIPPIKSGVVIKVYDGDTITIASKLPFLDSPIYRFSVRLLGIDCPEIKGKDDNECQCAQLAKKELTDMIMNKVVRLENIQTEKYGRLLADVYLDNLHINKHMIDKRLAVCYDGTKKKSPKDWMEYYKNFLEYYKDGINHN